MRTGLQYFSKGSVTTDRNRQKCSLNKIEENSGESRKATSHTNSSNLHNSYIESSAAEEFGSIANLQCSGVYNDVRKGPPKDMSITAHMPAQSRLSPAVQRNICYQNFRGFECKKIEVFYSSK